MHSIHAIDWDAIHARTCPQRHAVTPADNLQGAGNLPALTILQSVGAEKGSGAVLAGSLVLRTNCASRKQALSGKASNTDRSASCLVGIAACTGVGVLIAGRVFFNFMLRIQIGATQTDSDSTCIARLKIARNM